MQPPLETLHGEKCFRNSREEDVVPGFARVGIADGAGEALDGVAHAAVELAARVDRGVAHAAVGLAAPRADRGVATRAVEEGRVPVEFFGPLLARGRDRDRAAGAEESPVGLL